MPDRIEMTASDAVDIGKRYDIYVAETPSRVVVYRGAFFRGLRFLERADERRFDFGGEFLEIEQASGEAVLLRRHSVIKFCDAGCKVACELITPG